MSYLPELGLDELIANYFSSPETASSGSSASGSGGGFLGSLLSSGNTMGGGLGEALGGKKKKDELSALDVAIMTAGKTLPMVFNRNDKIQPLGGGYVQYASQPNLGAKYPISMADLLNLYKMSLLRRGGGG